MGRAARLVGILDFRSMDCGFGRTKCITDCAVRLNTARTNSQQGHCHAEVPTSNRRYFANAKLLNRPRFPRSFDLNAVPTIRQAAGSICYVDRWLRHAGLHSKNAYPKSVTCCVHAINDKRAGCCVKEAITLINRTNRCTRQQGRSHRQADRAKCGHGTSHPVQNQHVIKRSAPDHECGHSDTYRKPSKLSSHSGCEFLVIGKLAHCRTLLAH